jgi:hypothetical protein
MPVASQHLGRVASSAHALRLGDPAQGDLTLLHRVRGGSVIADVTSVTSAPDHFARKHIAETHNEDFEVQVGMGLSAGLFDWIAESWGAQPPAHDGAVLSADHQYTVVKERGFQGALIRETTFPSFDAGSKAAGYLTVRFTPRTLLHVTNPGSKLTFGGPKSKQKLWLASNFKLEIAGLDCSKVRRVAPFTVQRPIEVITQGGGGTTLEAGPIDFPSLRVTFPTVSAQSWVAWHQSFVVDGDNGPASERAGSLTLLGPNMQELARIELNGLGIFRLTSDEGDDTGAEQVATMTADLYCEQMTLSAGGQP